ncbi:hypothetical protein BK398_07295 [Escherichia coli]|nr:hypothetical protein BK398_07295 [Escherichia coli]OJS60767.1 hypothetical protein BK405_03950 [Escherichia coli]
MRTDANGKDVINIPSTEKLYQMPKLYAASLRDLTDCIRLLIALAGMPAAHFPVEPDSGATQEAHPL